MLRRRFCILSQNQGKAAFAIAGNRLVSARRGIRNFSVRTGYVTGNVIMKHTDYARRRTTCAAKRRWLNAHEEGITKAMGNRQVQMIAIGGAIGTGLL